MVTLWCVALNLGVYQVDYTIPMLQFIHIIRSSLTNDIARVKLAMNRRGGFIVRTTCN